MYIRDKKVINNAINFLYMESSLNISDDVILALRDICHCIDKESVNSRDVNKYSCYNSNGDLVTQFIVDDFKIKVNLSFINQDMLCL